MKKNRIVEAIENTKTVPVIETEKPKGRGMSRCKTAETMMVAEDAYLQEFEIEIPEALKILKKQKPFAIEVLIRRIICTGSNNHFVEKEGRVFSIEAFNGYHAEILAKFESIVEQVLKTKAALTGCTKKNRLMILAFMSSIGSKEQASLALNAAVDICIHASEILYLACFVRLFRGFGRMVKKILSRWYIEREPRDLLGEVLECKKVSVQTDDGTLSFDHRGLVRRLYLRGTDDLQDACFRIIKEYSGNSSEVPQRFLSYLNILALDLRAKGSVDTMCSILEGLPFNEHAYPEELQNHIAFKTTLFYGRNMTASGFMKDLESGVAFEYLEDRLAPRIEYILRNYVLDNELHVVDILRIMLYVEQKLPELYKGLGHLYRELEDVSESFNDKAAVFCFTGYDETMNKQLVINAYHRAKKLGCNMIFVQHGVIVLDPKTFTVENILGQVKGGNKKESIITSRACLNILSDTGIAFEKVVIYEETSSASTAGEVSEFLHALDTYLTAKNPNMRIVNHQLGEKPFSLFREPRHSGILVVEGDNARASFITDMFLED